MNEAMVGPVPGISEHRLPTMVPRNIAGIERRNSSREGRRSRRPTLEYLVLMSEYWFTLFMNSAMPNRPSASPTSSMPSNRLVMPKVKRGVPVSMSVPTMPRSNPSNVIAMPLSGEPRAAASLLGQRKSVETGHRVRWMTWEIEQDRADRTAILRAIEHARQHQDR